MYDICYRAINEQAFWNWAVTQGYLQRVEGTDPETQEPWTSYVPVGDTMACAGPFYPIVSEIGPDGPIPPIVRHTDPHFDLQFRGDPQARRLNRGAKQAELDPHPELVRRGAVSADQKTPVVVVQTDEVVAIEPPLSDKRKHFFGE